MDVRRSMRVNSTSHIWSCNNIRVLTYDVEHSNEEKILVCRKCMGLSGDAESRLFAVAMALQKYEH